MDRYYPMTLTVPGFTGSATPLEVVLQAENAYLADIEIVIPTGHVAMTGIRILQSHQQILPWGNLSWLQGDGYSRVFEVNEQIGARAISVQGYNDDFHNHTFYVRFHLRDIGDLTVAPLSPDRQAAQGLVSLSSALPL